MTTTENPAQATLAQRFSSRSAEVLSTLKAALISPIAFIYYAVLVFVAIWATLVVLFGIPGLYLPAVALVPVIYLLLIIISRG